MIGIVNYRAGNLKNLKNAFDFLEIPCKILDFPDEADSVEKLVFPGVGSFGHCAFNLRKYGFEKQIREFYEKQKPVLGICVGMQLFFSGSDENPEEVGLNLIPGKVEKFPGSLKIPQIGWNRARFEPDPLFEKISPNDYFYFLHSYRCIPENPSAKLACSEYGISFCSAVKQGSFYGVQFHPEKSHKNGLQILQNFSSSAVC